MQAEGTLTGWRDSQVREADTPSVTEETLLRRVSELETDKAASDQRHAGVMSALQTRRGRNDESA